MRDDEFPRALSLAVHELRTPVTVVAGYLRMVLKEQAGPITDKQRKMLEEAERSCGRISALVAELSDLGKLEADTLAVARQPIDLAQVVSAVAADMHDGDDRGIRVETRDADRPAIVTGDRVRVAAVVKALIHAAVRERGEPGVVVSKVALVQDTSPPWAVLAVGDESSVDSLISGARGTPPPFDEWRGGLGLALPVGQRVIGALGGALWSLPGDRARRGSGLRLPLRTEDSRSR
jgi:signal transduction histidine kinase